MLLTSKTANSLLEGKIQIYTWVNCHTSRIPEFVDYYLLTELKKLKFYVKDNTDFIKKIEAIDHVIDNSYLVSLDIRSLYTNIY